MRRKAKKRRGRMSVADSSVVLGDITVNDFANNEKKKGCTPKQARVKSITKRVEMLKFKDDDRAWYEKDDEEIKLQSRDSDVEGEQETCKRRKKGLRNIQCHDTGHSESDGVDYPLDVWFVISEHIQPEDVGRFGAICQATLYILSTARFWFNLYRRYHKLKPDLPEELRIWNLDDARGVRAAVIRALFYMYTPFIAHITGEKPLTADPAKLLHLQCILQWHIKTGNLHKYYFKFSRMNQTERCKRKNQGPNRAFVMESLVYHNPEEGCYILEVTSSAVCAVAMIMGEYLHHAGLGVPANLCNHRLRLSLVPRHLLSSSSSGKSRRYQVPMTEILFEPVSDVRVYPWWHPKYWQCGQKLNPE